MRFATTLFVCAALCSAQSATTPSAPAPAPTPVSAPTILKIGDVNVTGSFRERMESWDWFAPAAGSGYDNNYTYSGSIFRLALSEKKENYDWMAEFAVPFILGLPANPVAAGTPGALGLGANYFSANSKTQNNGYVFPKQLFFRFSPTKKQSVKVGRQEFSDGGEIAPKNATLAALKASRITQRLIGPFGFSHVGRSLDGVNYSYSTSTSNVTFMGAVPTRGVFQVDGWGWNKVALGYLAGTKEFSHGNQASETRLFAIYYDDFRPIAKTDNRPTAVKSKDLQNVRIQTYGGHELYDVDTKPAVFDFLAWGALQTGNWGTQIDRAYAFVTEAGVQPKGLGALKPWLSAGMSYGSGDNNPNDTTHHTFFQIIPTPRPFARMPFFNMENNRDYYGSLTLRPHAKITTTSEFHSLAVAQAADLWYTGGGVYQPWTFGYTGRATSGNKSLANLWDTQIDYRYNAHFTVSGYIGYAQGKSIIRAIYPNGIDGRLGYLEGTFRF